MRHLHPKKIEAILRLLPASRYDHFVKEIWGELRIWSLRDSDGSWALLGDPSGDEYLPIWPHENYAQLYSAEKWPEKAPASISVQDWIARWLPGLSKDNRKLCVFPTPMSPGLLMPAAGHRQDLLAIASSLTFDDDAVNDFFEELSGRDF